MPRKKHEAEKAASHERWLLTYADLITLLMIFFVLMYTISNVNAKKLEAVSASLTKALTGEKDTGHLVGEAPGPSLVKGQEKTAMEQAQEDISKYVEEQGLNAQVKVVKEERGLIVRIQETLLFPRGSATLTPDAQNLTIKVGSFLTKLPNHMRIEGHTCNLPIHTREFPSNWELSTARATTVVKVFIAQLGFQPDKISATGYGEFRPIVANDIEENRAQNRRVDILVLDDKYKPAEPK